ncbi:unnamed protein product [Pleuronectes platessa]|uniref:Uncharacterized protein n=1 Tax=Pleuronectes platessa TaxID=8262 RepID=A0A9N7TTZ1_PLEPL|nr:unnamed protein product [Pleuronectes platessa]
MARLRVTPQMSCDRQRSLLPHSSTSWQPGRRTETSLSGKDDTSTQVSGEKKKKKRRRRRRRRLLCSLHVTLLTLWLTSSRRGPQQQRHGPTSPLLVTPSLLPPCGSMEKENMPADDCIPC